VIIGAEILDIYLFVYVTASKVLFDDLSTLKHTCTACSLL